MRRGDLNQNVARLYFNANPDPNLLTPRSASPGVRGVADVMFAGPSRPGPAPGGGTTGGCWHTGVRGGMRRKIIIGFGAMQHTAQLRLTQCYDGSIRFYEQMHQMHQNHSTHTTVICMCVFTFTGVIKTLPTAQ